MLTLFNTIAIILQTPWDFNKIKRTGICREYSILAQLEFWSEFGPARGLHVQARIHGRLGRVDPNSSSLRRRSGNGYKNELLVKINRGLQSDAPGRSWTRLTDSLLSWVVTGTLGSSPARISRRRQKEKAQAIKNHLRFSCLGKIRTLTGGTRIRRATITPQGNA